MGFRFGWFSTGRDETARQLLEVVVRQISKGFIPGEVGYVFCNRMRGEAVESDQFIEWVESLGIPLILLSSNDFEPSLRQKNRETWRIRYHQEVEKRVRDCPVDLVVLAGYMLIVSEPFCRALPIINLHPAAPKGPQGTWQEVIWSLIQDRAARTGVMMHLVTKELDQGPPITFVTFPIRGGDFDRGWLDLDVTLRCKSLRQLVDEEGENNLLFREIRRQGVRRELPLIVMTLKAFAEKRIRVVERRLLDDEGRAVEGVCLDDEVESYIQSVAGACPASPAL